MKIAVVTPYDYPYPGGVIEHVRHLDREFRALGHETHIIAPSSKSADAPAANVSKVDGQVTPFRLSGLIARISLSASIHQNMHEILARENFDVIHIHEPEVPLVSLMTLTHSQAITVGTFHAMVENIFEEFSWRGYLAPRLEAIQPNPYLNSILTGFIWAGWHVPYYLYFLDDSVLQAHTPLSVPVFIMVAFLVLPFHAFAYGELRLLSKSTWTTWLLHNIANAISLTLISHGFVTLSRNFSGVLFSPGTEGILHSLLMGLIGYGLYQYRIRKSSTQKYRNQIFARGSL